MVGTDVQRRLIKAERDIALADLAIGVAEIVVDVGALGKALLHVFEHRNRSFELLGLDGADGSEKFAVVARLAAAGRGGTGRESAGRAEHRSGKDRQEFGHSSD